MEDEAPGIKRLRVESGAPEEPQLNAYICVFDLDAADPQSISPVEIRHFIRVSPERMTHHAFTEVPEHILQSIREEQAVLSTIRARLGEWWPVFRTRETRGRRRAR